MTMSWLVAKLRLLAQSAVLVSLWVALLFAMLWLLGMLVCLFLRLSIHMSYPAAAACTLAFILVTICALYIWRRSRVVRLLGATWLWFTDPGDGRRQRRKQEADRDGQRSMDREKE